MYLTIIYFPLASSILTGLFGKNFGQNGSIQISLSSIFLSFITSLIIFYEVVLLNCNVYLYLFSWVKSEALDIRWSFIFDNLSVIMSNIILYISLAVMLFLCEYMKHDPHFIRFMSYLSLFSFLMIILVVSDNFFQMFVGWEGVGLVSYLLINFWFTRIQSNKAAIKAMIFNRIGDFSLIIALLIIFINFKTLDYQIISALIPFFIHNKIVGLDFFLLNIIAN